MIALSTPDQAPHATGGDPLEYVSVSRLKSFLTCRLKFYFEKVLGLKKPVSPNLHLGKSVHAGLQHYNLARWRGSDSSEAAVLSAYTQAIDDKKSKVRWEDQEEAVQVKQQGEAVLKIFLKSKVHPVEEKPMGVEVEMQADLPVLPLPLLGIIDLVKADLTTCDYKTVGATPNLSLESWLHELQLTAYALLVEEATGEKSPGSELVYLVKTKTPKVISQKLPPPSEVQRDRFIRLVEDYAHGVANERYYPSPGQHCSWCSFRNECQGWRGEAA